MKHLTKAIYTHLITKTKYNKLLIKLESCREDLENKTCELNTLRRINKKEKEIWEQRLKEQEEEIIRLMRRRKCQKNIQKKK